MYLLLYLLNAQHLVKDTSSHVCPTMPLLHLEIRIREFRTDSNEKKKQLKRKKCKVAEAHYPTEKFMSISKMKYIYSCNSSMLTDCQDPSFIQPSSEQCVTKGSAAQRVRSRTCRVMNSSLVSPTSVPSGPSLAVLQRSQLNRITGAEAYPRTEHTGSE